MNDPFVCPCCGTDAAKLRLLADYVDAVYQERPGEGEVQNNLREWATAIEREAQP